MITIHDVAKRLMQGSPMIVAEDDQDSILMKAKLSVEDFVDFEKLTDQLWGAQQRFRSQSAMYKLARANDDYRQVERITMELKMLDNQMNAIETQINLRISARHPVHG